MRSRILYLASLLAIIFLVLLVAATLATKGTRASPGILYVAPDGDDNNNCSSYALRCRTVNRALDMAVFFDEILVATGVYTEQGGTVADIYKTVTLLGGWDNNFATRDPDLYLTTLDAQRNGRVIFIYGDISPTIDGFIITGGDATGEASGPGHGGGIRSEYANPIIVNNVITDNVGSTSGAYVGTGGGLHLFLASASPVISGNQIVSNSASIGYQGYGGGLYLQDSNATLNGNTISDNIASTADQVYQGYGGGLFLDDSDATLTGNTISRNRGGTVLGSNGGGLYLYQSKATVDGNRIISNTASDWAGGLYVNRSAPFTLTNNIIAYNEAFAQGGGMRVWGSSGDPASGSLFNNTIAENNLGSGSEGIHATGATTLFLTNNIIVSHTYGMWVDQGSTVTANHSLFFGNSKADTGGMGTISSTNEVSGDPLFVDPAAWDYHIQRGSPAIDAGTTVLWLTADIDGDPRPICGGYDIGSDEYPWCHVYLPLIMKNY